VKGYDHAPHLLSESAEKPTIDKTSKAA
jgi:hypothetical protein